MRSTIHRATLAHTRHNPFNREKGLEIIGQGGLLVDEHGLIADVGPASEVIRRHPQSPVIDYGDTWLLPGMVDCHIHFPQYYATAAPGGQLLDWLNRSIFPCEAQFADPEFATATAHKFVQRLLASGTTTALVFGSQFSHATEALFEAAATRGLRLISGITLMDRAAPESLFTPSDRAYEQAKALIQKYAHQPRSGYAITPRFALSCSEPLLEVCQALANAFPRCYVQTHINENLAEIEAVRRLFPKSRHYLDVYRRFGLLSRNTVLAHSIHSTDAELATMADLECAVCHCPASNLYLGSGIFPMTRHQQHGIRLCIGTDVAAGPHFSVLQEFGYVQKVQQLKQHALGAAELLYLGTLAGAEALGLENKIGSFAIGKEADWVLVSAGDDDYLQERLTRCDEPEAQLFVLLMLAGPHHVLGTATLGKQVFSAGHKRVEALRTKA